MRFDIIVCSHVLRKMPFECTAAYIAKECLYILMKARQMFAQRIGARKCLNGQITDTLKEHCRHATPLDPKQYISYLLAQMTRKIAHIRMAFQVQFQIH